MKNILLLVFIGLMLFSCCGGESQIEDLSNNIGKTVTIDGQVYTIVDHVFNEYKLSNGDWINDKFPVNLAGTYHY